MGERPHVRYSAVPNREERESEQEPLHYKAPDRYDGGARDLRYEFNLPETVPWKAIALALFLLSCGTFLLVVSHFIFSKHMGGDSEQAYGFLVLGILVFLPGFYETRIAYYSMRGAKGYRFSSIPSY